MIKTININSTNMHKSLYKTRVKCRGIVVKDSRILASHEINTDFYSTPGGSLEDGETLEECCAREVQEETGYVVKPVCHFLTTNAYYDEYKNITHYFLCDIIGESEQNLTTEEINLGLVSEWIDLDKILELYSKYDEFAATNENKRRSYFREYSVLTEYFSMFGI